MVDEAQQEHVDAVVGRKRLSIDRRECQVNFVEVAPEVIRIVATHLHEVVGHLNDDVLDLCRVIQGVSNYFFYLR